MIVTKLKWEDLERLRARSATEPARWFARGPLLLTTDEGTGREAEVAMFRGADGTARAAMVAVEHNRIVELVNIIVMIGRKLQDAQRAKAAIADAAKQVGG